MILNHQDLKILVFINSFDNTISANDGDNEIFAMEGNDLIDGFSGIDKSIYTVKEMNILFLIPTLMWILHF